MFTRPKKNAAYHVSFSGVDNFNTIDIKKGNAMLWTEPSNTRVLVSTQTCQRAINSVSNVPPVVIDVTMHIIYFPRRTCPLLLLENLNMPIALIVSINHPTTQVYFLTGWWIPPNILKWWERFPINTQSLRFRLITWWDPIIWNISVFGGAILVTLYAWCILDWAQKMYRKT